MALSFTHVQGNGATNTSGTTTSITVTLGSNPAEGSIVCVSVSGYDPINELVVSDSNGNVYTMTPSSPAYNVNFFGSIWLFYLINAPANASNEITASWNPLLGAPDVFVFVENFSVTGGVPAFDKDAIGIGNSSSAINTPTITPQDSSNLLFAAVVTSQPLSAPTAGSTIGAWTGGAGNDFTTPDDREFGGTEYVLGGSSGTAVDFTQGSGGDWSAIALSIGVPSPAQPFVSDSTAVTDPVHLQIDGTINTFDSTAVSDHVSINIPLTINVSDSTAVTDTPFVSILEIFTGNNASQLQYGSSTTIQVPYFNSATNTGVAGGFGSLIVVAACWEDDNGTALDAVVTDTNGNTYNKVSNGLASLHPYWVNNAVTLRYEVYYAVNVIGDTSEPTGAVTITFSGPPNTNVSVSPFSGLWVSDYYGFVGTPSVDTWGWTGAPHSIGTERVSPTVYIGHTPELIFAVGTSDVPTDFALIPSPPWTDFGNQGSELIDGFFDVGFEISENLD